MTNVYLWVGPKTIHEVPEPMYKSSYRLRFQGGGFNVYVYTEINRPDQQAIRHQALIAVQDHGGSPGQLRDVTKRPPKPKKKSETLEAARSRTMRMF